MKKVLFIATVVKTHINAFHLPYLKWFKDNGYLVHVAARNDFIPQEDLIIPNCDNFFDIEFNRSPFSFNNYKIYKKIKVLIENNDYDIIHCHTPVGGVLGRLAAKHSKAKVIYTAHGYHFYKGAPLINWLLFFPIEKMLSPYTDELILINKEDYNLAKRFNMGKKINFIPGVGININNFNQSFKHKNILNHNKFNLIVIGEINKNKNQALIIEAIKLIADNNYNDINLYIVGDGPNKRKLTRLIDKFKLGEYITFLGYRNDIPQILFETDILISSSTREGLPVNVMEAMASGKPVIVTNTRGSRDLIRNGYNGFVVNDNPKELAEKIMLIKNDSKLRNDISNRNLIESKKYSEEKILAKYIEVYRS